jgi:5S rRNA maturation endonuclease (ribonuclease M5)
LTTRLKEKQERIEQIITKLIEESTKGKLIVVEGTKDTQALRTLGVNGTILTVKTGGKSFLEATAEIEQQSAHEVILLLDFDRRGKEGTRRLKQDLERAKIKVDMRFWHGFQALVGREVQCVEGLSAYLDTLKKKIP